MNLIKKEFYEVYDEKLISLSILYLKTVKQVLSDRVVVQFFCVYNSVACDYENFVLSYLINKYASKLVVMYFDGESTHPLVRMVRDKYSVEEFPFRDSRGRGWQNRRRCPRIRRPVGLCCSSRSGELDLHSLPRRRAMPFLESPHQGQLLWS